jgi:hypothetical protein
VSFLTSHQISWIFQIVQQELIQSTSFFVQDLDSITVSVINSARVNDSAESVSGFGITGPLEN